MAIKETETQHIIVEPIPGRGQPHGRAPASSSACEHLLRSERRILFDFLLMLFNGAHRIVKQVAFEAAGLSLEAQSFVDDPGKLCGVSPKEAPLKIRVPTRVMNPRAEIPRAPCKFVHRKLRLLFFPCKQRVL